MSLTHHNELHDATKALCRCPECRDMEALGMPREAPPKKRHIPWGNSEREGMIAARELLRDGRADEALDCLTHTLDRYAGSWRVGTRAWG